MQEARSYDASAENRLVLADTLEAALRLGDIMEPTPLEYAPALSRQLGVTTYYKREDLTPVHSFKVRGAYNKMAQLTDEEKDRGALAASAGNHAQGVALSAQELAMEATIVIPQTTPGIKIEAVKEFGANVLLHGDSYSDAYDYSQAHARENNQVFIHPFDDYDVIVGQGTIGREILLENPDVTHIFVPIGGGGLVAGIAQYVKATNPEVQIIGVQSEESNAMQLSIEAGQLVTLQHVGLFADGVAVKVPGEHTFALAKQYVDEVISVTNDQVAAAVGDFINDTRGVLEPAGALAIAGAKQYAETLNNKEAANFVTICSGANISMDKLRYITERAELGRGREVLLAITLPETAGALLDLCKSVVNGHNITEFNYRKSDQKAANIFVGFSIKSEADKRNFFEQLDVHGYTFDDLSQDDAAKEHVRHMVGGKSNYTTREVIYEVEFPERPKALAEFLEALGEAWNISLFHYRSLGGDTGRVLIGFENPDQAKLHEFLEAGTADYNLVDSPAVEIFL